MVTLSDVVRDELVKTSSSEALQQNRQFLASLTVAQVYTLLYVYYMYMCSSCGEHSFSELCNTTLNYGIPSVYRCCSSYCL